MEAHYPHRPLTIQPRHAGVIARSEAIAQYEGMNAMAVQPLGNLQPFVVTGQCAVATTGTYDNPTAIGYGGQMHSQLRAVFAAICQRLRGVGPQRYDSFGVFSNSLGHTLSHSLSHSLSKSHIVSAMTLL